MSFIKNWRIGVRLAAVLSILVALLLAIGVTSATRMGQMQESFGDIVDRRMLIIEEMNELRLEVNVQARSLRNILLFTSEEEIKSERDIILNSRKQASYIVDNVEPRITSEKGKNLLVEIRENRTNFRNTVDKFFEILDSGQKEQAAVYLLTEMRPVQLTYLDSLGKQINLQKEVAHDVGKASLDDAARARSVIWSVTVFAILTAFFAGVWLVRSITKPINIAVEVAQFVANGDLTKAIASSTKDETGMLLKALSAMQNNLSTVVGNVRQGAEAVATASAQIAQGNQDLSSRTESQASALQETAASMEELASTVKQNADNSGQANLLAQNASAVAQQGGLVVGQVVGTMKEISDSSKKIADIIGVIDGIAFQTNILALNAAVEAARAGEQGRGFAVVASEVRTLAGRSANAAKEIKALISESVVKVEAGTHLVDKAGQTMSDVVSSIQRVTDIMGEISSASTEQSQGVEQIGEAVMQMDQVTQQNAALVEEMAAAASSLKTQAQELVHSVALFKLP